MAISFDLGDCHTSCGLVRNDMKFYFCIFISASSRFCKSSWP